MCHQKKTEHNAMRWQQPDGEGLHLIDLFNACIYLTLSFLYTLTIYALSKCIGTSTTPAEN